MSTENTPVESTVTDDLDAFTTEFFGQKTVTEEPASSEEVETPTEGPSAPANEDTHDGDDDTPADDENDENDDGEEASVEEAPKPKKNRFQERIDELTAGKREAERKALELEARLAKLEQTAEPTPAPVVEEKAGPTPHDLKEDGTDKYPLGEFDPGYIRDLTRHTLAEETARVKAEAAQEAENSKAAEQRAALTSDWEAKLGPAQERYPDFQTKGQELLGTFEGIDQAYGEYLTTTLMSMEFGPDVLYYLANNLDDAQKIVNSGPALATIALGRLEAKFADASEQKQQAKPKVSKAPAPPPHVNKGASISTPDTPDDTDDLDAFSAKLFAKKRGP